VGGCRRRIDGANAVYVHLIQSAPSALAYIQYQRFVRRTEVGVGSWRAGARRRGEEEAVRLPMGQRVLVHLLLVLLQLLFAGFVCAAPLPLSCGSIFFRR